MANKLSIWEKCSDNRWIIMVETTRAAQWERHVRIALSGTKFTLSRAPIESITKKTVYFQLRVAP